MSNLNNTSLLDNSTTPFVFTIPRLVRFWYFLVGNIASLTCALFTIYFLLFDAKLRRALNNHIIIVLLTLTLLYESINIPWHIRKDHYDVPWSMPSTFYLFWAFFDYAFYSLQISLFAWASIERHILIFHDQWTSTRMKRLFFHYIPIVFIIVYYLIFYSMSYFVIPCETSFDSFLAGGLYVPCAFSPRFGGTWDLIVHQIIPTLLIAIFSTALLLRVLLQKARMRQSVKWRKHRKMTIQLLSVSTIYLIFNSPWIIIVLAIMYGTPTDVTWSALTCSKFLLYNVVFLFPFVCYFSLPELRRKTKEMFLCQREQRRINPIPINNTRLRAPRTIVQS